MSSPRLLVLKGSEVVRALERAGFEVVRSKGSHRRMIHRDDPERATTVPVHKSHDLPKGTLRAIIAQAGLTEEQFFGTFVTMADVFISYKSERKRAARHIEQILIRTVTLSGSITHWFAARITRSRFSARLPPQRPSSFRWRYPRRSGAPSHRPHRGRKSRCR